MNEDRKINYGLFRMFLCSISLTIPLLMIDAPAWVISLVSLVMFLPFIFQSPSLVIPVIAIYSVLLRPGLYIWALIVTARGPQDFIAIAFYIVSGLQAISIIKNFIAYFLAVIFSMQHHD